MYGYWTRPSVEPTSYGQALQQSELYDPKTSAVIKSYVGEATVGVGTGYADLQALKEKEAENKGIKITEDEYKNNPDLFSQGIQWHEGMTDESAKVLKEFNDAAVKRQRIIADSSTAQSTAGITIGFGAGIVEPKNLAIGVTTSLVTGGLAEVGVLGNTMRRLYQARKAALGARMAVGAAEGVAAGAAVEPSNRYSAKTLQQDYTMADSLFNIATSTAFGAGLPAALHVVGKAGPFMQEKIDKFRGRAMDVVTAESDLATQQFVNSQRVDVSAVEAAEVGKLAGKSVSEQVRAAESFVRGEELPKIAAIDDVAKVENIAKDLISESKNAVLVEPRQWQEDLAPATQRQLENPSSYIVRDKETGKAIAELQSKDVADKVNTQKYDVVPAAEHLANLNDQTYAKIPTGMETKARQAAFGDKTIPEIVNKLDTGNTDTIQKHNVATLDHKNDTLIDYDAIDAADERRAIMPVEGEAEADAYIKEAQAEIQQMLDNDILNEADLKEYQEALAELKSASTKDALETLHLCMTRG